MTINELHEKFYIEYDKYLTISSYPNFTEQEINNWLNKSLLMLISNKVTGNNARKIAFEGDSKRISDLYPLVTTTEISESINSRANSYMVPTPDDMFIYISSIVMIGSDASPRWEITDLITHEQSKRFIETSSNKPWIKVPKILIEDNFFILYQDPTWSTFSKLVVTYIKKPDIIMNKNDEFQLNDKVADEVVTLAVTLALENIESQRFSTMSNTLNVQE